MHRSLILRHESTSPEGGVAIAAKGFRPFFLLAAVFACGIVPLWISIVLGVVRPSAYLDATTWHAHEMVFGYATAVLAGFLLTAVGNWTHRETAVGLPLMLLAFLWLLGRVALLLPGVLPRGVPAAVDLAFLPALVVVLSRPLIAAKSRHHFVLIAVIVALFGANVAVHLGALGATSPGASRQACRVAVDLFVLVIVMIAGRVFPMFTRNATQVGSVRSIPWLDRLAVLAMAALTMIDVLLPNGRSAAAACVFVAIAAAARATHWGARHTARHPLLWILHVGYVWVPIGLLLRGLAIVVPGVVPSSLATHALTVGAIGSLTLGMMARVALGHTGRPLEASRTVSVAFVAVTASALTRVVAPLLVPGWYPSLLDAAATLWTLAFALYLASYVPVLCMPRVDGRPG